MRTLHLFAGAGGGILADLLLGHQPVCAVEINEYCQQVLSQRQKDGCLPWFPIFGDIKTFYGGPWRGIADVVAGGFPCQDISIAGKGKGIEGERSGLWSEMRRVVCEVRPRFVFVENSPMLTVRGIGRVLGGLAEMGYDARWCVLGADDVGANHRRKRIFILAHANGARLEGCQQRTTNGFLKVDNLFAPQCFPQRLDELPTPVLLGKRHGLADFVERSRCIGNGQVPILAATAWRILSEGI